MFSFILKYFLNYSAIFPYPTKCFDFTEILYTWKYSPRFISAPFALLVIGRTLNWTNSKQFLYDFLNNMSYSNCLCEFKTGRNLCKCRRAKKRLD